MKKNIFVIDDEKMIRDTYYDYFSHYNYNVLIAEDGVSGLEKIKSFLVDGQNIDLVLCDIHMPNMSGIEMLKHLKKDHINLRFIYVTAYFDLKNELINESNVLDILYKPVELKQLLSVVEKSVMN